MKHAPRFAPLAACLGAVALSPAAFAVSQAPLESTQGMVVSAQYLASDVGAAILRQGGNAIDAAVAVGYALAVTHPVAGNLGGGGFMTIHLASGRDTFINFREKAPLGATRDMYLDVAGNPVPSRSLKGWLAAGVPGTVLGLETARQEYGTLPREALITPAIELAERGFVLNQGDTDDFDHKNSRFAAEPNVAAIFLHDGRYYQPGERLVQHQLAATLRLIRDGGSDAFYRGPIAAAVADASAAHGGILTRADFAAYKVSESAPVSCRYRGLDIVSAPPPSSGGVVLCQMLEVLEAYPLQDYGFHSSAEVHVMAEAMRSAFYDRNTTLGDPAFVHNPIERLLSPAHVAEIRTRIRPGHAGNSAALGKAGGSAEKRHTTHYSVVDRLGNAVSVTYTLNDDFGAEVIAGDTGFFLNDEMDDFSAKPGASNLYGLVEGEANSIAPGKQPLSSMTPTIVLQDGKPVLVLGTPGGSRIITTILEVLINVIDHGMTLQEAVDAPRFHQQWLPDNIGVERFALSADTAAALSRMGYRIVPLEDFGSGNAVAIIGIAPRDPAAGRSLGFPRPGVLYGAADPRAPAGTPAAP